MARDGIFAHLLKRARRWLTSTRSPQEVQQSPPMPSEAKQRQDARIEIRQARKAGNQKEADSLRLEEISRRAMASGSAGTAVLPNEQSDSAPSPFEWKQPQGGRPEIPTGPIPEGAPNMGRGLDLSDQQRQRIQHQAAGVMPPPMNGDPGLTGGSDQKSDEMVRVLKDMLETMKSIDQKLPQASTYSE